ncbi:MAG: DUF3810 domain-containing protein [Muribaculum sp.]|nr:DUF3810 domain-containing protein [Muribaculum sp.]
MGAERGMWTGKRLRTDRRQGTPKPDRPARKVYLGIAAATALLNGLAWSSAAFCDAYVAWIFPIWVNTYGRVTGWFPFSVGEWMLAAGIVLTAAAFLSVLYAGVMRLTGKRFGLRAVRKYLAGYAWLALIVCVVMTLNCSMLYHVSSFSEKYLGGGLSERSEGHSGEYSLEEFMNLRDFVAEQCNRLSGEVERDERGYILYPGGFGASDGSGANGLAAGGASNAMADRARAEMRRLGEEYGQLSGYYPRPKPMFFSDFMCQQKMLGWYFPFSMEANYNRVAYVMNQPASMCHELAHLKGFIYEDEANLIGYLACVDSEDIYFQYSGYLSVLGYLERDLSRAAKEYPEAFAAACAAREPVALLDAVYRDDIFVTKEEWERIEGKALLETETVDKATETFLDTTLKANGVAEGTVSYSHVVELLLAYYRQSS